jgi:threonine/homoserine/homoserine lactone efflux protein
MTDRFNAIFLPFAAALCGMMSVLAETKEHWVAVALSLLGVCVLSWIGLRIATANARLIAEQNRLIDEMWTRINKMDEESDDA